MYFNAKIHAKTYQFLNILLKSFFLGGRKLIDKNLLFICEVGARSGLAAEYASSMGSDNSEL